MFDSELYTRWLQYGVFQPIFRPHAQEHIAPEPVFHDQKTKALARKSITLRYQLLPYNYTLAFENSISGIPFMRPLFFDEPTNKQLQNLTFSYRWGDHFLITPVTKSKIISMDIPFPKGNTWYDFYNDTPYQGGKYATIKVEEDHIPTFVKGGSFIPMTSNVHNSIDMYTSKDLTLHYYHDKYEIEGFGQLYHDDGITPDAYQHKKYELIKFESHFKNKELLITLRTEIGKFYNGLDRNIKLVVHNVKKSPISLSVNQTNNEVQWNWDDQQNRLTIPVYWKADSKAEIRILL